MGVAPLLDCTLTRHRHPYIDSCTLRSCSTQEDTYIYRTATLKETDKFGSIRKQVFFMLYGICNRNSMVTQQSLNVAIGQEASYRWLVARGTATRVQCCVLTIPFQLTMKTKTAWSKQADVL